MTPIDFFKNSTIMEAISAVNVSNRLKKIALKSDDFDLSIHDYLNRDTEWAFLDPRYFNDEVRAEIRKAVGAYEIKCLVPEDDRPAGIAPYRGEPKRRSNSDSGSSKSTAEDDSEVDFDQFWESDPNTGMAIYVGAKRAIAKSNINSKGIHKRSTNSIGHIINKLPKLNDPKARISKLSARELNNKVDEFLSRVYLYEIITAYSVDNNLMEFSLTDDLFGISVLEFMADPASEEELFISAHAGGMKYWNILTSIASTFSERVKMAIQSSEIDRATNNMTIEPRRTRRPIEKPSHNNSITDKFPSADDAFGSTNIKMVILNSNSSPELKKISKKFSEFDMSVSDYLADETMEKFIRDVTNSKQSIYFELMDILNAYVVDVQDQFRRKR